MKIQLINCPLSIDYIRSIRTGTYPPPSLGSIAAFLKMNNPNIEVEIFDGELLTKEEIIDLIDADIVGLSTNIMTYEPSLEIAYEAKQKGTKVVIGGPYVNPVAKEIIKNRDYVDAVIVGEGEIPFSMYVNGVNKRLIPGLVYRKNGEIKENPVHQPYLDSLPIPDFCNLPLFEYFETYINRYKGFKPFKGSLAVYSRKGCVWREQTNGGCVFCMIPHRGMRFKSPKKLWDEIEHFYKEYGVDYFWEVSDTFTEDDQWLNEFLKTRPINLENIAFHIYGRPNHITSRLAKQLIELNVFEVFIGAESGDDQILKNTVKGCKVEHTLRAIESLSNEGIYTIISFVFGLPGETLKSLQKTIDLANEVLKYDTVIETSSSVLLPIPGSPSFNSLIKLPGMLEKYSTDLFDLEELKYDWIKNFTHISYDDVLNARESVVELFPLNNTFSQIGKQSAPMC